MVVTTILFTHTTFLWATCCLICFITIVKLFFTLILTTVHTVTDLDYGSYRLSNAEIGLTAGVTGQQGMLNPPRHLIPPPVYLGVRVSPFVYLTCNSYLNFETDYSSVSWPFHYLRFYVPLKNFSLIWRCNHCRRRASKCRTIFGAQGL